MFVRIATALAAACALSSPLYAEDAMELESDVEIVDLQNNENDEFEAMGWNRWQCTARATRFWLPQTFVGQSHFFCQGSGEGQYARTVAELIAIRSCEFTASRRFTFASGCQIANCQVQRY